MRLAMFLALVLVQLAAHADQYRPTIRMKAPTEYVSGQPLPLTAIEKVTIYCGGKAVGTITDIKAEMAWTPDWGVIKPGKHTCHATATAGGLESEASNTIETVVVPAGPRAPIIIVVIQ